MGKFNREWFSRAKIGLFTHYTYATYKNGEAGWGGTWRSASDPSGGKSAEEVAALFDAEKFAAAACGMSAQYVVFTVCHAGFNLLFPSEVMMRTGVLSKVSKTDVVADLLDALDKYDIPLVLYMPPNDDHDIDDADLEKMGWLNDGDGRERFINRLLAEIGERYGGRIAGFWFDQCGPRASAREVIARYNPDAQIWVNTGVTANEEQHPVSDFLVSEYYGQIEAGDTDRQPTHHSQINRIFGGSWWASGGRATVDAAGLLRYTVRVAATQGQHNGGVNWACGPYLDQEWEDGVPELMQAFGRLVTERAESIFNTVPGRSFVTKSGSALEADDWGVSTEAPDGSRVFLHVLNRPADGILRIGPPADQKTFSNASMPDGTAVVMEKCGDGYEILLQQWDPVDTVIILS